MSGRAILALAAGVSFAVAALVPGLDPATANVSTGHFSVEQIIKAEHPVLAVARTYLKYGKPLPLELQEGVREVTALTKRAKGSVTANSNSHPGGNSWDYQVSVSIGSPVQEIGVIFDTGSSDFWFFGNDSTGSNCKAHHCYRPEKSKTAKKLDGYTFNVTYGDQTHCSGPVYTDNVTIGGFTVKEQAVGLQNWLDDMETLNLDGIVGLSFGNGNSIEPKQQKTWFENMKPSLDAPLFTADLQPGGKGVYNFGYVNKSMYTGNLIYADVDSSRGYWMITPSGYSIGDGKFNSTKWNAVVDTGTSLNLVQRHLFDAWISMVSGSKVYFGISLVACDAKLPPFVIGIGDATLTIPPKYLNLGDVLKVDNYCLSGIQPDDTFDFSILGVVTLNSAFVVFDDTDHAPKVGFATKH
ncbi:acid protease [Daldinia caldariorum]|uniref:acid protease n=1 Tax=Daldinia caldariorum TaxID=326644 RepID=UPI0020086A04|nr:acid protease [Daldinia caldariorum]KAI1470475.1 acid protease [Daldinia caldariorum]